MEADVIRSPGTPPDGFAPDRAPDVTELFRAHHLELVRLALLMVGDLGTAEDVVQDTFEQLHRRWHLLRQRSSGLEYARSAVLNRCRSVLRRRGTARKYAPRVAETERQHVDTATQFAQRSELFTAFGELPRRQREVLVLRYYLDLSVADAAGALGISEGAVRSTASRGLAALASILHAHDEGGSR